MPHELNARINAVKLYRPTGGLHFVLRRYRISKASIMRWNKLHDGTIEETTRERFIYAYKEQSSYSTVDFVQWAIAYFGYAPDMIQTDNGNEFTHTSRSKRVHPLNVLCSRLHIVHKTICPATPWHNGKVERSHRSDQERFCNYLSFHSYEDLKIQMKRYLYCPIAFQ